MKLVIVATHPIQHFCPQYRSLATIPDVELTVVFDSLKGVESYHDAGFDQEVSWGRALLDGFPSIVLERGQRLGHVLDELSPDWLVVYGYASPIARAAWRWAIRHPTRRLAYISDSELRHHTPRSMKNLAKSVALRTLFRRINAFLTVGNANEEYYAAHGARPAKFVRMHFPIDVDDDYSLVSHPELRAQLGIEEKALVVLNVGKFEPHKRQQDLIEAIAMVPSAHLVLAGSGTTLEECKRAAAHLDNVTFLGFQQPKDLARFYALADVYAHPSTYDRHPLSVSEAAAAGAALVVSDKTGSWGESDDVIPGKTGFVVPAKDVSAWAEAIRRFDVDRELAGTMGNRARENSRKFQGLAHGGFLEGLRRLDREVPKSNRGATTQ